MNLIPIFSVSIFILLVKISNQSIYHGTTSHLFEPGEDDQKAQALTSVTLSEPVADVMSGDEFDW